MLKLLYLSYQLNNAMISNLILNFFLLIPTGLLLNIFLGLVIIGITVAIQAYGSSFWMRYVGKKIKNLTKLELDKTSVKLLVSTASFLLLLNFSQAIVWGLLYYLLPNITEFETLEKAIYFSLVTFTSLGYGEITISSSNRILAGFEAMNGILLLGWSTTLMFSVMQFIWKNSLKK
ncbi:potassium channel family protein [Urechidicola vernalis]|uniref:Potassium channel family protein n=1 Tax=Urechidicola vernalis TaxID=3075600 RepID=A0ABU2Y173_9FLAO|nr:potassium channel family protein [Urechidicola sp. P050]MDT0551931.1 potassium channel family protein [Urechidicola sp. P050]